MFNKVEKNMLNDDLEAGRYIKEGWSIDAGESIKAGGCPPRVSAGGGLVGVI